uniref:Uncharacterized protein n=1 Tax=Xiphophorus maculatus TaxID=8083 RepID=A0A3B5QL23_XIPMA
FGAKLGACSWVWSDQEVTYKPLVFKSAHLLLNVTGPSQQAAPLISLINRTKTAKQMGPAEEPGLLSDPPSHAYVYAHMDFHAMQRKCHTNTSIWFQRSISRRKTNTVPAMPPPRPEKHNCTPRARGNTLPPTGNLTSNQKQQPHQTSLPENNQQPPVCFTDL